MKKPSRIMSIVLILIAVITNVVYSFHNNIKVYSNIKKVYTMRLKLQSDSIDMKLGSVSLVGSGPGNEDVGCSFLYS